VASQQLRRVPKTPFTARTIKAALGGGYGDDAARFYAAEAAKMIQAFFHAAAVTGPTNTSGTLPTSSQCCAGRGRPLPSSNGWKN
jgi:hypothetical protein